MSHAQRQGSLADLGIVCPVHDLQPGRTRCRWCGFDPIKLERSSRNSRISSSAVALPPVRAPLDGAVLSSFPVGIEKDAYQVTCDVVE